MIRFVVDLQKNESGDFFYLNCLFPRNGHTKTTFLWRYMNANFETSYTIVSVDWTQTGKWGFVMKNIRDLEVISLKGPPMLL